MSDKIVLRDYSKVIFSYPILLASIIGWILTAVFDTQFLWMEIIWLIAFFCCTFIMMFDFTASKFITFLTITTVLGLLIYFFVLPVFEPIGAGVVLSFGFTTHFYILMTAIYGFLLIIAFFSVLFNYYTIERNELYHRQGIFTKAERYAISNVSFDKGIPDIFEFFMLGAGSLTFYPEGGRRLVRLNTVVWINSKEERLNTLLSKISVEEN